MKKLLITLLACMFLVTGCGKISDAIIKVNDKPITQRDFDNDFNKIASNGMLAQMNIQIPQDDNNFMYLMIKDRVVNELIVKELINQEILKRHIKVNKKDVDKELQTIIDKLGSKEQLNAMLKKNNISNKQFLNDLKEEIKVKKLVTMVDSAKVSNHEAEVYYKKNTSKFTYPDKVRASHILIMANPQVIENQIRADKKNANLSEEEIKAKVNAIMTERQQKAQGIYQNIKNLPDEFEKTAREESEDIESKKNGGDVGFFAKEDMAPTFSQQAFSQQPNTISPVIQTPYGFHIIKVTDRMAAGKEPFVKVREQIKLYLQVQKQMTILEKLVTQLKKDAKIEYVNDSYNPEQIQQKIKAIAAEKQNKTGLKK